MLGLLSIGSVRILLGVGRTFGWQVIFRFSQWISTGSAILVVSFLVHFPLQFGLFPAKPPKPSQKWGDWLFVLLGYVYLLFFF
jgi:hypothetical protein